MFSQVRQALDSLAAALDGVDAAPTAELREALGLAKPLRAKLETLETAVASQIAGRERHGDGGAGVLHQVAAVPRSDAARNVRVAAELEQLPDAQSALADGEMSMANAARLARVARQTSSEAVQNDPELVNMAKALPPDEFAHASQRWTAKHLSAACLAARHRRNRRNRNVRFWNGEDGSVQMRGAFDAEMGARIGARIRAEADRLRQADRRLQRGGSSASLDGTASRQSARNGSAGDDAARSRDQRMADALDRILTHAGAAPTITHDPAYSGTAADNKTTGCAPSNRTGLNGLPTGDIVAGDVTTGGCAPSDGAGLIGLPTGGIVAGDVTTGGDAMASSSSSDGTATDCEYATCGCTGSQSHKTRPTQIIVRAELADLLRDHGGMGEIAGAGPVPASVIDRLCCNADISIVLFGKQLTPLYEATAARAPTAAQRRALIARDGACIGCGATLDECEAHHILPWRRGGPTQIDNLVLVCWRCHDLIHDHNWQVVIRDGRYRLVPPDATSPPNRARSKKPTQRPKPAQAHEVALFSEHPRGQATPRPERPVSSYRIETASRVQCSESRQ